MKAVVSAITGNSFFCSVFSHFSRFHLVMLGLLVIITLIAVFFRSCFYLSVIAQSSNRILPLEVSHNPLKLILEVNELLLNRSTSYSNFSVSEDVVLDRRIKRRTNGINRHVITIGDTLNSIFTQYGIDTNDITLLIQQYPMLRNLRNDQSLSWILTSNGDDLQHLIRNTSYHGVHVYNCINSSLKKNISHTIGQWNNNIIINGQLHGSFVDSVRASGLIDSDISAVIKALQWQLDFRKLRTGEKFSILVSRDILNGKITQSQLLAVRLHTGGKDYYAFRANDGKFYNRDAVNLNRDFMRFPTEKKFRISSNFNPRRLNPATGRITPHRGIDFAMPIGTPVLAVGDGEVVISERDVVAGNYVTIYHGYHYMTRYMHLKKLLVKPGQKVKRGDRIALSGNTGRSTGPHLHFEVWINQRAVDPLTTKLPCTEELSGRDRIVYLAQVKKILPQLQFN